VRDARDDVGHLREHAGLIERLDDRLVVGVHEGADRRQRRRQRDLETHMGRDDAVALQNRERAVGAERGVGEPEVVEADVLGALART
jgi:hypothetical protein